MAKQDKIKTMLIDVFDRIEIQTPENFDAILEFVNKDISSKEVDIDDVAFSFKKWIESKK